MPNNGRSKSKKTKNIKQTPKNPQKRTEPALTQDTSVVQGKHSTEDERERESRTPENNEGSTNVKNDNSQPKNEANKQVGYQENQKEKPASAPKKGIDEVNIGSSAARNSAKEENSASGTQGLKTAEKDRNQPETKLNNLLDTQLNREEESGSTQDAGVVKINHSTEDQREMESRTTENNEVSTNVKSDNSHLKIESNEQVDSEENKKEKPACMQEEDVYKIELSAENKDHVEEEFRTTKINDDSINDRNNDNQLTKQSNKQVDSQINKEVKTALIQEADINKIETGCAEAKNTAETEICRIGTGEEGNLHDIKINYQDYSLNQEGKPLEETSTESQTEVLKILNQMKGTLFLILLQNKFYYEKHYGRNKQKLESGSDSNKPKSGDDPRSSEETKKEVLTDIAKDSNEKSLPTNDSTQPSFALNDKIKTTEEQTDLKCQIKTEQEATAQAIPADYGVEIFKIIEPHSSEETKKEVLTDIEKESHEKSLPTNDSTHANFVLNDEIETTAEQSDLKCEIKAEEEVTAQSEPAVDGEEISQITDPHTCEETKKEVLTDIEKESNEQSLPTNDSTHASFVLNEKIKTTQEDSDLKFQIKTEQEATAQANPADGGVEIFKIIEPHSSEETKKEVLTDIAKESNEKSLPSNDSTHPNFVLNDEIETTAEQSNLKCEIKTEEEATALSEPAVDGEEISQITTPEHENGDQEIINTDLQEEVQTNGQIKIPDELIKTNSLNEFVSDVDPDVTQPIVEDIPDDPLRFHAVHGENIIISKGGFRAQRLKSSNFFSKGVAFSSRPVKLGEQVCFRLEQLSSYWLGLITFGFTNKDPNTLADNLPSNIRTDQDSKDGYWVVHLDKKYCQESNKLHYFLNSSGNMCFGINGVDQGEFFWKLDTSKPIWAMVYIFGYFTALEFDNPKILDHRDIGEKYSSEEPSDLTDCQSQSSEKNLEQTCTSSQKMVKVLPLSFQIRFVPMDLNTQVRGVRVQFLEGRGICVTSDIKGGYIFLKEPLIVGKTIVIQNLSAKRQPQLFCIGIKYHPTIQGNAKTLNNLPDPVAINISMQYKDELGITFTENGEIRVTKNCEMPNTILINAKLTQQLWPFVAICRRNQIIRIWSNNIPTSTMIKE